MARLSWIILLVYCCSSTLAFPNGAPEGACTNLQPSRLSDGRGHAFPPRQTGPRPRISCRKLMRSSGAVIILSVNSPFKGILAQVRDQSNRPVGRVRATAGYKGVCFQAGIPQGITHTNANQKLKGRFQITVNANAGEGLRCVATVVTQQDSYWVGLSVPAREGNRRSKSGPRRTRPKPSGQVGKRRRPKSTHTPVARPPNPFFGF